MENRFQTLSLLFAVFLILGQPILVAIQPLSVEAHQSAQAEVPAGVNDTCRTDSLVLYLPVVLGGGSEVSPAPTPRDERHQS